MSTAQMTQPTQITRTTQARVLHSEWTKLRTLPSTAWSLATALVLIVGFGAVYSMVRVTRPPKPDALAAFDSAAISLAGVNLAQFAIGVLGVLLVTGEYATGTIQTSFAAVPRRLPILWGKVAAFALVTFAVCAPAGLAAFLVGQSILSAEHLDVGLDAPGVARAVLGSALYLTVVGVIGLALGAVLRTTAGAIAALFGALFGLQLVVAMMPESVSDDVYKYLPSPAGLAVTAVHPDTAALTPWAGFAVFGLYAAAALGLAAWRLRRA
jgi:ABC-type transport system involved in multi-copper enzyme maturation permease subunit